MKILTYLCDAVILRYLFHKDEDDNAIWSRIQGNIEESLPGRSTVAGMGRWRILVGGRWRGRGVQYHHTARNMCMPIVQVKYRSILLGSDDCCSTMSFFRVHRLLASTGYHKYHAICPVNSTQESWRNACTLFTFPIFSFPSFPSWTILFSHVIYPPLMSYL